MSIIVECEAGKKVLFVFLHAVGHTLDWPQSLKQFFINVSYHIPVASLALMALF